ncbi:Non-specific lipid transfer protein GPI-anchored 2 [Bienertia sinuspersici]
MTLGKIEITITLVVMLVPVFWEVVDGQPIPSCPGALTSLTPCLSFSTGNSSAPSSSCCLELANMLQTAPVCLCNVLNGVGAEALGAFLNRTIARALPTSCNMQTPSISQCDGLDGGDGAYSEGTILKIPLLLAMVFVLLASTL